ncbi:PEP-CTERM sorting domain-containing protein [Rubrivivax rivuli]|uniref:PEP-CTERM sorting domain-containing protein n=2 Tax=Rubrivivax rivuli TaxID=1862385 RepID=A0A437RD57_9BURK|nr:PEP-CTERM sorting domain-containing protein [Rubrivivax rivuli]
MTRTFGATVFPSLTFTLASAFTGSFSFNHYHNHNPGFPTTPSYQFDVQLSSDGGTTWTDIGSDFIASAATNTQQVTLNSISLAAGTNMIRWVGNTFAFGNNSGSEYFGLDNVQLVAPTTQGVPEPATLALAALGLLGAGLARRRTR